MTESSNSIIEIKLNGPMWLVVACNIEGLEARHAVAWFTEHERLRLWWGDEHEITPCIGGEYIIRWPTIGKTLRGQIADIGETYLIFSWTFDDEPDVPARVAAIHAVASANGATIEIRHGPYRANEADAAERQGHLDGWRFFLPRLAAAVANQ